MAERPVRSGGRPVWRRSRGGRPGRSGLGVVAIAAATCGLLFATLGPPPRPRLVWNASASAPVGLYRVRWPDRPGVGDMVVAWTPEPARGLAARRHYLPANVPLVKRVAATAGARVCAAGEAVWIDGRLAARRRDADSAGRSLPSWSGCRILAAGELFLLMDPAGSFDGRYFGETPADHVVGRAVPLWVR